MKYLAACSVILGMLFLLLTKVARPNLVPFMGRMYQARYLAGLVAGCTTRTGAIGYVAATNIPEVVRGIDAFALGVRRAAPEAKVYEIGRASCRERV